MELEKRIRQRLELQETEKQQKMFKQLRQQAEQEEEEEFKRQVGTGWDVWWFMTLLIEATSILLLDVSDN